MKKSPSKKLKAFKRVLVFMAMTLSVLLLSVILVLVLLGYRFNRDNGQIEQGGLVQFISRPTNAEVTVGKAVLANKTRSKITLYPGNYDVKMALKGYKTWQKNVTVQPDKVLWLNSAHLVPDNPLTDTAASFKTLQATAVKSGGKLLALQEDATKPVLSVVEISGDDIKTDSVTIPTSSFQPAKDHRFTLGEWSSDQKYLLVRHDYGKLSEWLVVNIDQPNETKAIMVASDKKTVPVEVLYDTRSSSDVIVRYSDGSVRSIDLDTGILSDVLVRNTATISLFGSTLLYTTLPTAKKEVTTGYLTLGKSISRTIATYSGSEGRTSIAGGRYFGDIYLATTINGMVSVETLQNLPDSDSSDPIESKPFKQFQLPGEVTSLRMMTGGRFIVMQQEAAQTIYDIELDKKTDVPIVGAKNLQEKLSWLDDFHFWNDANGSMRQYEFDGTNQTDIVKVARGFDAVYSPNLKYLYTIGGDAKKGFTLQQTRMIIQ